MIDPDARTLMNYDGVCTQVVGENLTAREALEQAELNWKVGLVDAGFRVRGGVFKVSQSGRKAVCRLDDDGAPVEDFGYVGKNYRPIQNAEKFDFADALVSGGARYEAAWSMRGGREVGLLMTFPDNVLVGGEDPIGKTLLLRGRHDGTGSVIGAVNMVRLYCTNQLDFAVRKAQRVVRIPHLANASQKMSAARETLGIASTYEAEWLDLMNRFTDETIGLERANDIVREVLTAQRFGGLDDKVTTIAALRETSTTIPDALRNTKYGVLQAATEWLDWGHQGKTPASKLHDMLDGRIHGAKDQLVAALANSY